jgi:hypothetical protein
MFPLHNCPRLREAGKLQKARQRRSPHHTNLVSILSYSPHEVRHIDLFKANDLWIDKFEPVVEVSIYNNVYKHSANLIITQLDLAVHKRKIQDVRQWLLEALDNSTRSQLKKYRVRLITIHSFVHD